MIRWPVAAFAVIATLLVMLHPVAAASAGDLVVVANHTTDSEFSNATTLSNVSIEGSGEAADVVLGLLNSSVFTDDFEDGDLNEYAGSSDFTTQNTFSRSGSWAINKSVSGYDGIYNDTVDVTADRINASVWYYREGDSDAEGGGAYLADSTNNGEGYFAHFYTDEGSDDLLQIRYASSATGTTTKIADTTVSELADGWYKVNVQREDDQVTAWVEDSGGNTVVGPISGTHTLASVNTAGVYGNQPGTTFDDLSINSGKRRTSGEYESTGYTGERLDAGYVNLTLDNASADVIWEKYDSQFNQWNGIGSDTFTSSGNHTIQFNDVIDKDVRVRVTFNNESGETTARLHDEGVMVEVDSPQVDNSSASPTGNLQSDPSTFEINASDQDFPSDELTVDFYLDGSQFDSTTLTSNGTATVSAPSMEGGSHTWHAEVTDEYGVTQSSNTFSFSNPDQLRIYNESNSSALIDDRQVDLTFYFESGNTDEIYTKNTTDGTVDMTGLPVNEPFVVVAEADGYLPRRIFVPSLYETQSIYLLNDSKQYTEVVFEIRDFTGDYPQDSTVLQVERSLNNTWTTVLGDYFGANGEFPAQLRYNTRHRLVILNTKTGEQRVLGTYTPLQSGPQTVTVSPEEGIIDRNVSASISFTPGTFQLPARANVTVNTTIDSNALSLTSYSVSMYYLNESAGTNTTLYQASGTDSDGGTLGSALNLSGKGGGELKVISRWETSSDSGYRVVTYGINEPYTGRTTFFDGLAGLLSLIPGTSRTATSYMFALGAIVLGTTAMAGKFRLSTEAIAIVAIVFTTAFASIGWVGYDLLFAEVVAAAAIGFLRRGY